MAGRFQIVHVDPAHQRRERAADAFDDADGFEYTGVSTADQALDRLSSSTVDAIVTGDQDGVSLLRSIRAEYDGVAVVFLSDSADPSVVAAALNGGADRYVDASADDWAATLLERTAAAIEERTRRETDRRAASIIDSLFEQAPEHIHLYVKDEQGTHIRVTDTLFDAEMLLGKSDYEVVGVPPGESETYQDDLHVIETGESIVEREERSPLYERWLSTWKVPWHDDEEVVGLIGFTQDITERKRYEQQLETLTDRFELALEVTGVGVLDWDLNSRDVNFHGNAQDILALDERDTLSPSVIRDRIHPDDTDALDQLLGTADPGSNITVEFRIDTDRGWRWVELAGECRTDETGTPERVIGIVTDVTQRKQRQRDRRRHRRRITALHDVAVGLQYCETATEICTRTIEAADDILAFDQCVITLREDDLLPIEASSDGIDTEALEPLGVSEGLAGQALQRGESSIVEDAQNHPVARPRGDFRSVLSVPVGERGVFQAVSENIDQFDDDCELAELLVTHTETALKRLERTRELESRTAALQRQNERLDRFASIVGHDLRNPLQVARGHLELADATDGHLDRVEEMHERMEALLILPAVTN